MSNIRLDHEVLAEISAKYAQEAEKVSEVINSMDGLLGTLESEWEGEAARAYAERYQELRPSFEACQSLISEISQAIQKSSEIYRETDSSIANAYRR